MAADKKSGGPPPALSGGMAAAVAGEGRRGVPASGIVWKDGGVVATADHVLERDEDIMVTAAGGQRVAATLAGRDPGSDVAVLRIAGASADPAELAPGGSSKVGHLGLAPGRPG